MLQHPYLVAIVKACRGFIHHERMRCLRKRTRNKNKLLFPTGKLGKRLLRKLCNSEPFQCREPCCFLLFLWHGKRRKAMGGAHKHHLQHGIGKCLPMHLWDIGNAVRERAGGQRARIRSVHENAPFIAAH